MSDEYIYNKLRKLESRIRCICKGGVSIVTNFIGTTDNVPLSFRVNNQKAGIIDNTLANTFFGYQAGDSNTTGDYNTVNGYNALFSNTTGYNNTANGADSLRSNTTGGFNTANGTSALQFNTTGSNNTANGATALQNNTEGFFNTANGVSALFNNTTGNNNTALGYNTGIGITTGGSNTILGANVIELAAALSNNIIIADGDGNKRIWVDNTGKVKLPPYGSGTFTGTPTYALATDASGNIIETALGGGVATNVFAGTGTLVNGTATINNTSVDTPGFLSSIVITIKTPSGTRGFISVPTRVTGTSFTVQSTSSTENSTFDYVIVNTPQ